jgi:putative Holliday junction resolvase
VLHADGWKKSTAPSATASISAAHKAGSVGHGRRDYSNGGWCTLFYVRALGIDYGRRRIGLALSDPTGMLARPWKTIEGGGGPARVATVLAAEIAALASEADGLAAVAIGYPRRLNGEPTDQTAMVEQIVAQLRKVVELPIVLQDERLSSREAESLLARREKDWRKRKPLLDAASAAVILQDYLDGQARAFPRRHDNEDAEEDAE